MTTGRDRYLAERVSTASPEQLIMMLLDRAVAELQLAQQDLTNGDRLAAAPHLRRAQDIVGELRCSLDLTVGSLSCPVNCRDEPCICCNAAIRDQQY